MRSFLQSCFYSFCFIFMLGTVLPIHSATADLLEEEGGFEAENSIDTLLAAHWKTLDIEGAPRCSEAIFLRRIYLDMTGRLPDPATVRSFLQDQRPRKRVALIEALFESDAWAEYWALKWGDALRVKAEFPINLWPNGVQAYHYWVREALRNNMPYDHFVRALLTSSGSNFRVPPVNFYRAIQGPEPESIAAAVALTFMGARIKAWPEEEQQQIAAFFSRVAYKKTAEWKEEIVLLDPAPAAPIETCFPNGIPVTIGPEEDPRCVFADWLIAPDNPWFARAVANRIWAWVMGRGIIHEADDLRPDNPATCPALLEHLENELIRHQYDLRHLYRLIFNSAAYQQSARPRCTPEQAQAHFAAYPLRRLEAEVLIDAINLTLSSSENYSSPIPEPFTFIPNTHPTVALADGSISSPFLEMFGRPSRDTGRLEERNNLPSEAQRLHLLNSSHIQKKIENSWRIKQLEKTSRKKPEQAILFLYTGLLSRPPEAAELETALTYLDASKGDQKAGVQDLAWALINSKEFLYRH